MAKNISDLNKQCVDQKHTHECGNLIYATDDISWGGGELVNSVLATDDRTKKK